jgi:hypothetical protein
VLERVGILTMAHRVYGAIVAAVRSGRLTEPFSKADFKRVCPGFGAGTYQAFLAPSARSNPTAFQAVRFQPPDPDENREDGGIQA